MVRLRCDEPEAGTLVDAARRDQNALRPQSHGRVARGLAEAQALLDQPPAEPAPARLRIENEQAQLGDLVGLAHRKHRADALAVKFGDPAALALCVEILDEL